MATCLGKSFSFGLPCVPIKLSWSKTWENATSQVQNAIACIFRYQKTFGLFAPQDIFKLFDSVVCPILTYGAEVWGISM